MPLIMLILLPLLQTTALDPQYAKLPNGIRTCVVPDRELGLVSVQVWIRAGTICDPPHRTGLTRLAHEILRHRGGAETRLHSLGLAGSSDVLEEACYFETLLPSDGENAKEGGFLDRVLAIRAAQLAEQTPTPAEIERAIANVAAITVDPDAEDAARLRAAMFPNHPYVHPPGFVAATLADASPAEVTEHFERWIAPTGVFVLVVGDIEPAQAASLVKQHFGKIPWREAARRRDFDNPPPETVRIAQTGSSDLEMAWLTPSFGRFEAATVHAAIRRLCDVLTPEFRAYARELLIARRAGVWALRVRPPAIPGTTTQPRSAAAIEGRIRAALEQIAAAPMAEEDLNRLRAGLAAELGDQRLDFRDRALLLGRSEVLGGDLLLDEYIAARPQRLTVGDVQFGASLLLSARTVIASGAPASAPGTSRAATLPPRLPIPSNVPPVALGDELREAPIALPTERRGPPIVSIESTQRVDRFAVIAGSPRTVIAIHATDPSSDFSVHQRKIPPGVRTRLDDLSAYRGIERAWRWDRAEYVAPGNELALVFDLIQHEWSITTSPPAAAYFVTGAGGFGDAPTSGSSTTRPSEPVLSALTRTTIADRESGLTVLPAGGSDRVVFSLECSTDAPSPMQAAFDLAFYRRAVLGEFASISADEHSAAHSAVVRIPLNRSDADKLVARVEQFKRRPGLSPQELKSLIAQATIAARLALSDTRDLARELAYSADPWAPARINRLSESDGGELLREVMARASARLVFEAP
ncbi:MAG: insulinase family protein [Phycisphaerales bacterium]|nr:insulinase family protein [Phycisphaerales bacterium]